MHSLLSPASAGHKRDREEYSLNISTQQAGSINMVDKAAATSPSKRPRRVELSMLKSPEIAFLRAYKFILPAQLRAFSLRRGWGRALVNLGSYIGGMAKIAAAKPSHLSHYLPNIFPMTMRASDQQSTPPPPTHPVPYRRSYGNHPSQIMDIYPSTKHSSPVNSGSSHPSAPPTVVFVHGGAWGSGHPYMYKLVGMSLASEGINCIVLGYRTYPCTDVNGQVGDLIAAFGYINDAVKAHEFTGIDPESAIYACGHSSGAHIIALSFLKEAPDRTSICNIVRGFIGLNGPYHLWQMYEFHRDIGINDVGPLCPANGGKENFDRNSPVLILEERAAAAKAERRGGEGNMPSGTRMERKKAQSKGKSRNCAASFPRSLLLHNEKDCIIPCSSSERLHRAIASFKDIGDDEGAHLPSGHSRLVTLPEGDHFSTLIELAVGGDKDGKSTLLKELKLFCC